jgi:tetratricopeptide (TPR) repeat protein
MIPRELTRRFANGKGALFVGAGMSKAAKLPDWEELVAPLRDELMLDETRSYSPEQIAGWFEIEFGRKRLTDAVSGALLTRGQPTKCHKLLAALPTDMYFTTNFDTLLEDSLGSVDVVINDVDFSKLDAPDKKQVIKVHGDLGTPNSIVFTKSDYDHYLENRPAISDLIRLTLMQRTVLFLGYSFSDRNLTTILAQVGRRLGDSRRTLYAVIFDASHYEKKELETKYGVTVIEPLRFPSEDKTKAMRRWLGRFVAQIDLARKGLNESQEVVPLSQLSIHAGKLIGRQEDVDRVKHALLNFRFVIIDGESGTGKSALAIEVARQSEFGRALHLNNQELMFARAVYIDACGHMAWSSLRNHLLGRIAEDFGLNVVRQLDANRLDEKESRVRALLQIFRVLIIVDNGAAPVRVDLADWLRSLPEPSAAIMVWRGSSEDWQAIHLSGLPLDDAIAFLRERITGSTRENTAELERLAKSVDGNPQGMKMLLGQRATSGVPEYSAVPDPGGNACERVLLHSWTYLSAQGRQLLAAAALFQTSPISETALQVAAGIDVDEQFYDALNMCKTLMLLEINSDVRPVTQQMDRYQLHPQTAAWARRELESYPAEQDRMYGRLAAHYLVFVRTIVVRRDPPVSYWNTLATQDMIEIDDEWPAIRQIMDWAITHAPEFVESMLFLLVHYMDTRSLHQERIKFCRRALAMEQYRGERLKEALLRIDALGWTLIHEGRIDEARNEIHAGLDLLAAVGGHETKELYALAHAWLAQAACVQDRMGDAEQCIDEAIKCAENEKDWIKYRVQMVAGDVRVRLADYPAAIECYAKCRVLVDNYGGEEGYQMLPRLGMTYLLSERHDLADKVLSELYQLSISDNIEAGILYARYGFAYLAAYREAQRKENRHKGALSQLEQLRGQLSRATSSNLLLHVLMDELERRLNRMALP